MATQEPADPDSVRSAPAREGAAVLALAMSAFVLNLNANVMGALLPFVRGEFGFGDDGGALLVSAAGAGSAVGALVVADAGRRLGRRAVLGASLGLFVLSSLAHLFVASFWPLLTLRVLAGLSTGVAYAAASAAAADLAPYERRGAVMSKFNAGLFLAIPVGLPLTVWLSSTGWWRATFVVQAAVGLLALALSLRSVPPLPPTPAASRLSLLKNGGVLAVLAATMLHVGSFFTVVQLGTSWLDDEGLVPKEQQVWVWVGLGALSVVGSVLFGRLSDRLGKRRFVLVTSAVLVVCFFALSRSWGRDYLLPIGCVLAVAAAARTGPLQALVSGLVPAEQLGALMGLRGFAMQLGVFLFAFGASALTARLGFRGVLLLAAVCQTGSYLAIRFGVQEPRGPA